MPGRPANLVNSGQGPTVFAVGAGGVVLLSILIPIISSFWKTARYTCKLKYCLGAVKPKIKNQTIKSFKFWITCANYFILPILVIAL